MLSCCSCMSFQVSIALVSVWRIILIGWRDIMLCSYKYLLFILPLFIMYFICIDNYLDRLT